MEICVSNIGQIRRGRLQYRPGRYAELWKLISDVDESNAGRTGAKAQIGRTQTERTRGKPPEELSMMRRYRLRYPSNQTGYLAMAILHLREGKPPHIGENAQALGKQLVGTPAASGVGKQ